MSARWLVALLVVGCAPTGTSAAQVDVAPQLWPVPDGTCPALPPGCTLELGCPRLFDDDALEALDDAAIEASITTLARDPNPDALRRLLELHEHERMRMYPEALQRDVTADVAASRGRRAAIEDVLREHAAVALRVALTTGSAESLPESVVAAVDPVLATSSITEAIACGRRGPDPQWVPALASIDHAAAASMLRELVRWPAASVQIAALAQLHGSTDAEDMTTVREAVMHAWSPWVKRAALAAVVGAGVAELEGVDCRESLSWPLKIDRGGRIHTVHEATLDADLDALMLPEAWGQVVGERTDLRFAAHVAVALEGRMLFGVHRGEFGGGLFVRERDGTTHMIDPDPVVDMLPLGDEVIVVSGTDHLGALEGRVMRITAGMEGRLVRRHRLELPAAPQGLGLDEGGALLIPTARGVVTVDQHENVQVLGCDGRPQ